MGALAVPAPPAELARQTLCAALPIQPGCSLRWDAGVVAGLPQLHTLNLRGCRLVTDAGVQHLAERLEGVKLEGQTPLVLTDDNMVEVLQQCEAKMRIVLEAIRQEEEALVRPYLPHQRANCCSRQGEPGEPWETLGGFDGIGRLHHAQLKGIVHELHPNRAGKREGELCKLFVKVR